jgi:hypothetical protein
MAVPYRRLYCISLVLAVRERCSKRLCVETASIPAATLRAPLDRPLHRLYVGRTDRHFPYSEAVFACFPHPSVCLHGPLQSRPLGRKEQVDYIEVWFQGTD